MDEGRLAELERLAAAATLGPWGYVFQPRSGSRGRARVVAGHPRGGLLIPPWVRGLTTVADCGKRFEPPDRFPHNRDAEFIAAARSAVPELVAEVRRLRALAASLAERVAAQSELLSRRAEG